MKEQEATHVVRHPYHSLDCFKRHRLGEDECGPEGPRHLATVLPGGLLADGDINDRLDRVLRKRRVVSVEILESGNRLRPNPRLDRCALENEVLSELGMLVVPLVILDSTNRESKNRCVRVINR